MTEELKQFADIRRYKLILYISAKEVRGYFVPYDGSTPPRLAVDVHLNCDEKKILSHIENAVYDNPILLEDYETTLLVVTPELLFFPKDYSEDGIYEAMNQVYAAESDDVFIDDDDEETVAYYLAPGLKSFLNRTFPGVSPRHHLSVMKRKLRTASQHDARVYADIDGGALNLLAFSGNKFLHGSVHQFNDINDAAYYIFALWESLGFAADEAELNVSGPKDMRGELMTMLRRHINYVMLTILPSHEPYAPVPACVSLL